MPKVVEQLIPAIIALESFCAAAIYAESGDWKHTLYWVGAFIINASVTLL